jgi:hypothetical protein
MDLSAENYTREGKINGLNIYSSEKPSVFISKALADSFSDAKISRISSPQTIEEEEMGIMNQQVNATDLFEKNRLRAISGLRAIIGYIFKKYDIPKGYGADFGSGATGAMIERLMAPFIDSRWVHVEINPKAVEENRKRHPSSVIVQGSYHKVKELGLTGMLNVVTGLSSLDATQFMPSAISNMTSALTDGGYFLHVQDVRPGIGVGFKELTEMGEKEPFSAKVIPDTPTPNNLGIEPLFYETKEGLISVGELFRRQIEKTITQVDSLELLENKWITARRTPITDVPESFYYLNICSGVDQAVPNDNVDDVSAVVTVARKKRRQIKF